MILSFFAARQLVEQHAATLRPTAPELYGLLDARGLVLAEDIAADRDFPPFPRATRDGYAVRAADLAALPARLQVVGELHAGGGPATLGGALQSGQAVEIMTGAPAPPGADAVVMVEYTTRAGGHVAIARSVTAGENIVPAGAEGKAGEVVLARGVRLDAARIAVAAAVGRTQLAAHRRPRVAILATGDEVVDIAAAPGPTQIRNSNSYALAALVAALGGDPVQLPIAPDEPAPLRHLIVEGLSADLLLLTGGVSMGKHDLVEPVLAELGAEFFFTGVAMQPGKPLVFGRAPRRAGAAPTCFLGLPGNPVSTLVCGELFARPLLDGLSGARPEPLRFLRARLAAEIKTRPGLTRFLPGVLSGELDATEVRLARWQGSGDMISVARANCWVVVPPDRERIAAGEDIGVIPRS